MNFIVLKSSLVFFTRREVKYAKSIFYSHWKLAIIILPIIPDMIQIFIIDVSYWLCDHKIEKLPYSVVFVLLPLAFVDRFAVRID